MRCHGQHKIAAMIICPRFISTPTLHIIIGMLNLIDTTLIDEHGEDMMKICWYTPSHQRKNVFNGGAFEGNKCRKFIKTGSNWEFSHPLQQYQPLPFYFDLVVEKIFIEQKDLSDDDLDEIASIIQSFLMVWKQYEVELPRLTEPLKLYVLAVHVLQLCDQ